MSGPFAAGGPFKAGGPFQARGPFLQSGAFELSGQAGNAIEQLGGADFTPLADYSNCWQMEDGTSPCARDTQVGYIDAGNGFWGKQATAGYKPFLRDKFSYAPVVSSTTGETWTFTGTPIAGRAGIRIDSEGEKYFDHEIGATGNNASTPNAVANQITGDACWVTKFYVTDFSAAVVLLDKFGSAGNYGSELRITALGKPAFAGSGDGTAINTQIADASIPAATKIWLRIKRTASTGALVFETSPDGITWTQNGTAKTGLTGALFNSTDAVTSGRGYSGATGKFRLYYAAAYANDTGTGTPAFEFYPQRDCTNFPLTPYLDYDGTDDRLETNIAPGMYDEGYLCGGWTQVEALGGLNGLFGSSGSNSVVRGVRQLINAAGQSAISRVSAESVYGLPTANSIAAFTPFITDAEYSATAAKSRINSGPQASVTATLDYRGSTQVALLGCSNNAESVITPVSFTQGYMFCQIWLPSIPTDEQQAILRAYCALKAGVTL